MRYQNKTRKRRGQIGRGIAHSAINILKNVVSSNEKVLLKKLLKPTTTIAQLENDLDKIPDINILINGLGFLHWLVPSDENNEKILFLLDKGADINLKDSGGFTPLMSAAMNVATLNLRTLVQRGANLEEKDKKGATAMWLAAYYGMVDNTMYLLEAGANGDVCDDDGRCAIDVMCDGDPGADFDDEEYMEEAYTEILYNLCRAGARGERCDDIRAENARHQRILNRTIRGYKSNIPEVNVGPLYLPKNIMTNEKSGDREPIANAISWEPIQNGDIMVDFHDEMKAKRFYKKSSFNEYAKGQNEKGLNVTNPYNPKRKINSVIRYTARIRNTKS
jgi:hypothetical protein